MSDTMTRMVFITIWRKRKRRNLTFPKTPQSLSKQAIELFCVINLQSPQSSHLASVFHFHRLHDLCNAALHASEGVSYLNSRLKIHD